MAPLTRSATGKNCEKVSATTPSARKRTKSAPCSAAVRNSSTQRKIPAKRTAIQPPMPPSRPAKPKVRTIEWYSIEGPEFENGSELLELSDILQEICRHPGCDVVVRQDPRQSPIPKFFVIEWRDDKFRTQYLESEASKRFAQAAQKNKVRRALFISPIREQMRSVCGHPHPFCDICEVLTIYFPLSVSDDAAQALDRMKGPMSLGGPMSGDLPKHPLRNPYEGLTGRHHGWADGIIEYQGQPARRMIYILWWLDELAQQQYREEAKSEKRTRDGHTIWDAMDTFYDDLEELGMLGYETQNVQFQEILKYN